MPLVITAGMDEALHRRVEKLLPDPRRDTARRWDGGLSDGTAVRGLVDSEPAIVILGPELDDETAFSIAEMLDHTAPGISVVLVNAATPNTWRRAVATGVRGIVAPDAPDAELAATLVQALEASRRYSAGETTGPARPRVITFVSPKGGVGKTVLSANLAVALVAARPDQVVLVDLDLQFGDISYALMLTPTHTMQDAAARSSDIDLTTLKLFLTRHETGLHVLCAPDDPAVGEEITADRTSAVVRMLASEFRYVVVDTPGGLGEHALAAIEQSTDVILVSDMDVPSVRNLRKALDALGSVGMTTHLRHFVLNRADSRVGLAKDDVAMAAGIPVDVEVPSSRQVPISLNEGRPLVLTNPRSPVARQVRRLAGRFAEEAASTTRSRRGRR